MPELPEVETVRAALAQVVSGKVILQVHYHRKRIYRPQAPLEIKKKLLKQKIQEVTRRAKFLIIKLSQGYLLMHLGMSGQIIIQDVKSERSCFRPDRHTHFSLTLSNDIIIHYRDPRMFGRINFYHTSSALMEKFSKYGPEPLSRQFNRNYFLNALKGKAGSIKSLLLNQQLAPGMGNIYTDEALFLAGIHPATPGKLLNEDQAHALVWAIKQVLQAGIKAKGTSISDFCDPYQQPGQFQMRLKVYGRQGDSCYICHTIIKKKLIAQRGTHWCPQCQMFSG